MKAYFFTFILLLSACFNVAYAEEQVTDANILPEVAAAAKLSEMTGIALNPLLIGGAFRAWQYQKTPEAERVNLHWTAQPWFWGSLLAVGLLFLLNGSIGRIFPPTAKLMDAVESLEGKVAPLYTAPMLIPLGVQFVQLVDQSGLMPVSQAVAGEFVMPMLSEASSLTWVVGTVLALFIMSITWLSNQAIHTLVLLSPLGVLSILVRMLQFSVIALLLLATWIHPVLGMFVALLILFACLRLAGWSFRLTVFGSVFAWDWLGLTEQKQPEEKILAFSGSGLPCCRRQLGYLMRQNGGWYWVYRPWLIFPKRTVKLVTGSYVLLQGVSYHQLLDNEKVLVSFPPRYRVEAELLAQKLANGQMRDSWLRQGLKGAWVWMKESFAN